MEKRTFLFEEHEEEDGFKVHTKIAKILKDKIVALVNEENTVNIGLLGKWGSGKSFIINKLEKELNDEPVKILKFDGWKFNGKSLERSILFEIERQIFTNKDSKGNDVSSYRYMGETLDQLLNCRIKINAAVEPDKKVLRKKVNHLFLILGIMALVGIAYNYIHIFIEMFITANLSKQILEAVIWIGSIVGILKVIAGIFDETFKFVFNAILLKKQDAEQQRLPAFSSEQFENIFKDMINKIVNEKSNSTPKNKKVLIVFDNIDRCQPNYAYEIITTIKTYMELENCIYIIPCDDYSLKKFLSSNNFSSKEEEFLDKFFTVTIRIPKLTVENFDTFIDNCFNKLGLGNIESRNIIKQVLYHAYKGETPRQVKRFLNDFSMYYALADELDKNKEYLLKNLENFSVMIAIKQKWPEFESYILENNNFREDFYNKENEKIVDKITKFDMGLYEFLKKVKDYFNNSEDLYSYIYFLHQDDSEYIRNQILLGNEIELNSYNSKIFNNVINYLIVSDTNNIESSLILQSLFISIKNQCPSERDLENLKNKFNSYVMKVVEINNNEAFEIFLRRLRIEEDIFFIEIFKDNTNRKDKVVAILRNVFSLKIEEIENNKLIESLKVIKNTCIYCDKILTSYFEQCINKEKIKDFFDIISFEEMSEKFDENLFNTECLEYVNDNKDLNLISKVMDPIMMPYKFEKYMHGLKKNNEIKYSPKIVENIIYILEYMLKYNSYEKYKDSIIEAKNNILNMQKSIETENRELSKLF